MKTLTTHHDGYALNNSIVVEAVDEPGPGGAHHEYRLSIPHEIEQSNGYVGKAYVGTLRFQNGPRNEEGSIPGVTEGAVLAVLIDRLEAFQGGKYACTENANALRALRDALSWVNRRAINRARRNVLGTTKV